MRANKIRTGLTVLGMIIGIASVVIVYSAGEGIRALILKQIESFGTDFIETEVKVPTGKKGAEGEQQSATSMAMGMQVTTLKEEDMKSINKIDNVKESYAAIMSQQEVSYGSEHRQGYLYGVSSGFINIDRTKISEGDFFNDNEDNSLAQIAVLGSKMKEKLFGDKDAIGKFVKIKNLKFRVIGVMEERGAVFGVDFDDYIYVPIKTLQKKLMGIDYYLYIVSQLKDTSRGEETADQIRQIVRSNHDITNPDKDDFRVMTMEEALKMVKTVTDAITLLLLTIVAISLIVGGVGIMNIMYVAITERTQEIGLRKAVGAKYADIMFQFLGESVLITLVGGILGILLGVGVSYLIALGAEFYGLSWTFTVPLEAFVVALGFSIFFGILFGLYPAKKAARLNPIDALRNE